jgi:hypothetical protein
MATTTIAVDQGKSFSLSLRWNVSNDGGATKTPVSLVGKKARMQIKSRVGAPAWVTVVSDTGDTNWSSSGNIVLEANGDTGRVDIFIGATLTKAVVAHGIFELKMVTDVDEIETLIRGPVNTTLEVTA